MPGRAVRAALVGYLARLFTAGDPAHPLTTVAQAGTGGILLWVVLPYLALAPAVFVLRQTNSPWFRSVFALQPRPELMSGVPLLFQLHALSVLLLFAAWPFARLVHMLTAPLGCLTRPCIVHRSREPRLGAAGSASGDGGRRRRKSGGAASPRSPTVRLASRGGRRPPLPVPRVR
ncbi:respiratory nitrate reductase subunit gamma [Streptomyces sp. 6-11-2]|uniref:respiratory nitrate reductase subunit gamma n=1 Tax=Streptomyces sp. 6-11-2 TaxID=2585753 RepID=UPI00116D059F|nr:hypothetical protein TNCT6_10740 [Streptomyces sp. 6-11-2]